MHKLLTFRFFMCQRFSSNQAKFTQTNFNLPYGHPDKPRRRDSISQENATAFTRALIVGMRVEFGISTPGLVAVTLMRGTVSQIFKTGDPAVVTSAIVDFKRDTGARLWPFNVDGVKVHIARALGGAGGLGSL